LPHFGHRRLSSIFIFFMRILYHKGCRFSSPARIKASIRRKKEKTYISLIDADEF